MVHIRFSLALKSWGVFIIFVFRYTNGYGGTFLRCLPFFAHKLPIWLHKFHNRTYHKSLPIENLSLIKVTQ